MLLIAQLEWGIKKWRVNTRLRRPPLSLAPKIQNKSPIDHRPKDPAARIPIAVPNSPFRITEVDIALLSYRLRY